VKTHLKALCCFELDQR